MNKKEALKALEGAELTNFELHNFLIKLTPKTDDQANLINRFTKMISNISINGLNKSGIYRYLLEIDSKSLCDTAVPLAYENYEKWCEDKGFIPESKKCFTQNVFNTFGYTVKVCNIKGKSTRVFKSIYKDDVNGR